MACCSNQVSRLCLQMERVESTLVNEFCMTVWGNCPQTHWLAVRSSCFSTKVCTFSKWHSFATSGLRDFVVVEGTCFTYQTKCNWITFIVPFEFLDFTNWLPSYCISKLYTFLGDDLYVLAAIEHLFFFTLILNFILHAWKNILNKKKGSKLKKSWVYMV